MITLFLASQIPRIKTLYSTDELVEEKIPSLEDWRSFKKNFKESQNSLIVISPKKSRLFFSERELCEIREVTGKLQHSENSIRTIQSSLDLRQATFDSKSRLLFPQIVSLDCDSPQRSEQQMLQVFKNLDVKNFEHNLFSRERNDLTIFISFLIDENETSFSVSRVKNVWNFINQSLLPKLQSVDIFAVGSADYLMWVSLARAKTAWIYALVLLSIVLGLRFLLGTWTGGLIFIAGLITCLIVVYGCKAILGSPTDLLSDNIVLLLAITMLEDFMFVSFMQLKNQTHWRKSIRLFLFPSFWTSLTTFIGFGSLIASDLNIIQRLGLWAAIGALLEWIVVFFITPIILPVIFKKRTWVDRNKSIFNWLPQHSFQWRLEKPLSFFCKISFVLIPMVIWYSSPLRVVDSFEEIFPSSHIFSQGLEYLKDTRGWKGRIDLQISEEIHKEKFEKKLEEQLDFTLQELIKSQLIVAYDRAADSKKFVSKNLPLEYLPLAHRLVESSEILDSFYGKDGAERIALYLKENSTESFEKLKTVLAKTCPPTLCQLRGSLYTKSEFTQAVAKTFIDSSVLTLILVIIILVFLAVSLNRTREVIPIILASLWAPLAIFAVIKGLQVSINFVTCIVVTLLLGLTGDNVIQFLFGDNKSTLQGVGSLKGGAVFCSALMALVSLLFLLTPFQPVRIMGGLTALGFIAILVGDIIVLKMLLHIWFNPLPKN